MRKIVLIAGVVLVVLAMATTTVHAQTAAQNPAPTPRPAPTWEQLSLTLYRYTFRHMLTMAREFPEDKFDAKPYAEGRSFLEELWHVTAAAQATLARAKGETPDRSKYATTTKPRNRDEIVTLLESATNEVAALHEKTPNPQIIGLMWDANEHYAKMVVIYRMHGMVPPSSRRANPQ